MDPREVAWGRTELPLTKHSGRAAVAARLKHLGFKMTDGDIAAIFSRFKEIGDKKKFVYDDDLVSLVEGHITEVPETWTLDYINVTSGSVTVPTATVRLRKAAHGKKEAVVEQDAGIGERAGNASLEEIVMALKTRADVYKGFETGGNSREIVKSARLVSRMSGLVVQRSKAIVGENAFAHSSGIHQDGILKKR